MIKSDLFSSGVKKFKQDGIKKSTFSLGVKGFQQEMGEKKSYFFFGVKELKQKSVKTKPDMVNDLFIDLNRKKYILS